MPKIKEVAGQILRWWLDEMPDAKDPLLWRDSCNNLALSTPSAHAAEEDEHEYDQGYSSNYDAGDVLM